MVGAVLETGIPPVVPYAVGLSHGTTSVLLTGAIAALLAPYLAHLLSAIYYRLTDPDRPLIDPGLNTGSLWEPALPGPDDSTAAHN